MAINHKKIADLAGVSISTVSKALSGSTEISKESAERIRRIAIECGYFEEKKRRKREYCNNASICVAVLVPLMLDESNSKAVTFLKDELEASGAHIAVYFYNFDENRCEAVIENIILSGAADGVIVVGEHTAENGYNLPFATCILGENDCAQSCHAAAEQLLAEIL